MAALLMLSVLHHRSRIEELLGGAPDAFTVVPSTRGVPFNKQPLRNVLNLIVPWRRQLVQLLEHDPNVKVPRRSYRPEAFRPVGSVEGARVVLVEDLWVSGAKAVSAAGSLIQAGAHRVVIVPIARMIDPPGSAFFAADHPYFEWMMEEHDYKRWPREGVPRYDF
ncbi:MAG TPA: hypothetical protein VF167_08160 [Longimicrobiaceae bacterium]